MQRPNNAGAGDRRPGAGVMLWAALLLWPLSMGAQTKPDINSILERLDRLEEENRVLLVELRALRTELEASRVPGAAAGPAAPSVEERLDIQEQRVEEQAQTKVEASQRFPIRLTGMALFNSFLDSRQNGGSDYPVVASAPGPGRAGATVRQSIVGLEFRGPQTVWDGKVHGAVYMDFFAGGNATQMRLRTASLEIDWKTRSILAGVEKPIFNPREPSSLAQVGISPLTGVGNLWLWLPQVRVEQDVPFGAASGLRARLGVVETREVGPYAGSGSVNVEAVRPGLEGRFEFFHNLDDNRRLEFAPGFHTGTTHAGGFSIPSTVFSLDWFFNPLRRVEFTGAFYSGQNVAALGSGTRQGYAVYSREADPVHSRGGWGQITIHTAPRLDVHVFSGQQDDRRADLIAGGIGKNLLFGANFFYHLAPNVILAPEFTQLRSLYVGQGTRINNHYDLALAYLF